MKPTHKLNGGIGATLCKSCSKIINTGFTDELLCEGCQERALELLILTQDGNIFPDELNSNIVEFLLNIDDEES